MKTLTYKPGVPVGERGRREKTGQQGTSLQCHHPHKHPSHTRDPNLDAQGLGGCSELHPPTRVTGAADELAEAEHHAQGPELGHPLESLGQPASSEQDGHREPVTLRQEPARPLGSCRTPSECVQPRLSPTDQESVGSMESL